MEKCADPSKREALQSLGLVRERISDQGVQARSTTVAADYESSADALADFMSDLGLASEMRESRRELATEIVLNVGSETLRTIRLRAGLSQRELASRIQSSQPHISALEAGKEGMSLDFADKLAVALGTNIQVILDATKVVRRV